MKTKMKRMLSILISVAMIVTMFGSFSFADEKDKKTADKEKAATEQKADAEKKAETTKRKARIKYELWDFDADDFGLEEAANADLDEMLDKLADGATGEAGGAGETGAAVLTEDPEYVTLTDVGATSFTITWMPNEAKKYVICECTVYEDGSIDEKQITDELPAGTTTYKLTGMPAGYYGLVTVWGYDGANWGRFAIGAVNTKPVTPNKSRIGLTAITNTSTTLAHSCSLTDASEGVQFEIIKCGKTSGRRAIVYADKGNSKKFDTVRNAGYKYRARRVFLNPMNGQVYFGNWCGWKYFDNPSAVATSYASGKIKVSLKKAVGVKSYKLYIKKGTGAYKLAKTVKVTSKSSYNAYLYKCYGSKLKRHVTYKVKIVPIMSANGAASPVYAEAKCYIP